MSKIRVDKAVELTGKFGRDFVAMLAPHHQSNLNDNCLLGLRQLRIAQALGSRSFIALMQKIDAMKPALGKPPSLAVTPRPIVHLPMHRRSSIQSHSLMIGDRLR
jgi:hypothetical protein